MTPNKTATTPGWLSWGFKKNYYIRASLKTYLFLSFVEDPEFFGGEELKVR